MPSGMQRNHGSRPRARLTRDWVAPVALAAILAIVHTWPLATAPGVLSRNDNGDAQLNEWILAWVPHALVHSPLRLFQGNIFYPAHDTLAFSEPLIVPALLGAPIGLLGGSPVLVFNLLVLAGFALTAFAGYALMFAWTGDRAAALLTGSTLAFNTHTLTRLAHVQALHLYGLPLALLAIDRLLATARVRDALWLAFWMTVMAYTSGYLLVFGTIMAAVVLLVRMREWLPRAATVLSRFALAAFVAACAIVPLAIPYQRAATEQRMVRSLREVAEFSATPKGYLAAAGRLHYATWSAAYFKDPVDSFFPGFIVIGLSIVVLILSINRRSPLEALTRRRVAMLLAVAAAGAVLSLGLRTPVYGWLYSVFPPMRGLRAAARFGNLFLFGMSALAGLGLAALRARWRSSPAQSRLVLAFTVALIAIANVEALRAPFLYRRFTGIPRLYTLLRSEPNVVLAEVPFYPRQAVFENAEYVLNSTVHWRPLMNGYSGYTPATYNAVADVFWYFPREYAIDAMRKAGVTHIMVHPTRFGSEGPAVLETLAARPDFELMGVAPGGLHLYRLH
jgi:hypothetical protein